jgi:hypothetical protein
MMVPVASNARIGFKDTYLSKNGPEDKLVARFW